MALDVPVRRLDAEPPRPLAQRVDRRHRGRAGPQPSPGAAARSTTIERGSTSTTPPAGISVPGVVTEVGVQLDDPLAGPLAARHRPRQADVAGVEHDEEAVVDDPATIGVGRGDGLAVEEHADALGVARLPVVLAHLGAVEAEPGEVLDAADLAALEPAAAPEHGVLAAQVGDAARHHVAEVLVDVVPVEPRELAVLAVGVVVAVLGAAELVAAEDHRHALRQQQRREDVAPLAGAQGEDLLVVGLALDAAVPRAVVRLAVAVVLAVGLVVLVVVRDEVAQREAVVGGDEVDRRRRPPGVGLVQVGAAGEAVAELGQRRRLAAPEVADRVAVAAVPLRPQRREVADLVAALADVPRLGDQLDLRDDGVLLDEVEERRQPVDGEQLAGQRRREVEAEAVDVHLGHPVAQAVHDQLQHVRVAHVEAVAGAREVEVVARLVVDDAVVGEVVDAAHRQHRAHVVALGGVVVDDVEDHLDARRVQRLDHRLELLHLALRLGADDVGQLARGDAVAGDRVAVVRGEEGDRVVAPVVAQAALGEVVVVDELVHRHQLDGRDAERRRGARRRPGGRGPSTCRASPRAPPGGAA